MVSFEQKQERIALQVELEAKEREFQRTKKQIGQLIKGCSRRTPKAILELGQRLAAGAARGTGRTDAP